jgi:hypothetical protein
MKVISETLGHSRHGFTADSYTSVIPQVALAAAEATAGIVPRRVGPNMDPKHETSGSPKLMSSGKRWSERRLGDLNPGWAVNPNRIGRADPAVQAGPVS